MSSIAQRRSGSQVPEIVRIVLTQADYFRRGGMISQEIFDQQLHRIVDEELEPLRLTLVVRELADGRTRFLIKDASSGQVREMFEAPPADSAAE